ncbi:MAG: hypothetical protein Kow0068_05710 [Marinilabiliales bacterium]
MKRFFVLFLTLVIITNFSFSQIFTGKEADNIFNGAIKIRYKNLSEIPNHIIFRDDAKITTDKAILWLKKQNANTDYIEINKSKDKIGNINIRYKQYYKGYPVEFSNYILHVKDGKVYSMNGDAMSGINCSVAYSIDKEIAIKNAMDYSGAEIFKWQVIEEENLLKREQNNPGATYYPNPEKIIFPVIKQNNIQYRPAYKIDLYAHKPLMRSYIYVDAQTGDILFENKLIHTADVQGTAITSYSGTRTITTDSYSGSYRLREAGRGNGIETYDMNLDTNYGNAVDFTDTDNTWNNVNAELDQYATDAHWAAEMTYDYYYQVHGRNSIDNNGLALKSYVHFNLEALGYPNNVNAFWDGYRMSYGDGNGSTISPLTTVDICGHEITHGLTSYTANLTYQDESGALNEGFSDIFGTTIEFFAKPSAANWTIGEDIGQTFRSLADPNAYGLPDTYQGTNWYTGTSDNGGVHTNCGVLMHWYYILAVGETDTNDNGDSYSVTGIGIDNAADIAYRMLTVYLTNSSDYFDARYYAIQSAIDLFGACSPEVAATTDAFYAVGVGNAYVPYTLSDFEADLTESCNAPMTVNFTNLSVNGTNFYWDFGDGTTSTTINPSHTYNNLGSYTVTLIADGGTCGTDTLIMTDYINIDTSLPCVAFMPSSGSTTHYSCSGKLYDTGGPNGNYPDQTDVTFTIAPPGATQISLSFVSFDVEPGSGSTCDYDYIAFYDGPDDTYPLINNTYYCNTTGMPPVITSTGGQITIRQYSDQALNMAGFELDWQCMMPSVPPSADFSVNQTTTCTGIVSFTDLSTNGPTSWEWDFGDGTNSTQQNPTHTYSTNGTYSVSLIVTNQYGSDTIIENNLITVNLPPAPTTTNDTICENDQATLTANGTGTIYWYDAVTGGNLLDTGNTFITPALSNTTTYYAEDVVINSSQYVGETNNTSNGGFLAYEHYLVFDCYVPATLVSVEVNAESSGNRTIELRDAQDNTIQSTTINIASGISRINLSFDIPVANNLKLVCTGTPNLYRNNAGTNYPYVLPGILSINYSSASSNPTGYYYYFYDWEVQEAGCISPRTPAIANVVTCTGFGELTSEYPAVYPNPTENIVNIKLQNNNYKPVTLSVYDVNNKLLYKDMTYNNEYKIDFTKFKNGLYILNIKTENSVNTFKIVKINY